MKYFITHIYLLFFIGLSSSLAQIGEENIQNILTLEEAVDLAISNNKEILIQKKQIEIAKNNVYQGNAGLLPTVNLVGSAQYTNNQSDIKIRTFQPEPPSINFNQSGVTTTTYQAAVQAEYVIIGGFSGKYRYKLLENGLNITKYQQENLINNTVLAVAEIFIEIAKLQSNEELLLAVIKNGEERIAKIKDRIEFGKATGLQLLRAQTDVNQDYSSLDDVILVKENLVKQLNFLIDKEQDAIYRVAIEYNMPPTYDTNEVIEQVRQQNPTLRLVSEGIVIANDELNLSKAALYPQLSAAVGYGYFNQRNDVEQLASVKSLGLTAGLSLRYNIFNGSKTKRSITNAVINIKSQELKSQQAEENLITQALQELNTLKKLKAQLERETKNINTFEEAFNRTQESYYNGKANNLDLRDTQTALLNTQIKITEIKLEIIASEITLKSLTGQLVNE
jgi:outer membrane protein TolC